MYRATLPITLLAWMSCSAARAHDGPPFPVLIDEPISGYFVSVWADPDIGVGRVFIMTDPQEENTAPSRVEVWIQPKSKRLPKANYPAARQDFRNRIQFLAEPEFDQQEMFSVGIVIYPPKGDPSELTVEIEATPPGLGPWDWAIYLSPFFLFGGLWVMGLIRRWRS
jgi:hypothetical protein